MFRSPSLRLACVLCAIWIARASFAQTAPPAPAAADSPRSSTGHPCTLWDNQDVAAYKAALASNPDLKAAFDQLQEWGNGRISDPLNVPAHTLEASGMWTFPDYARGYQDASGKWNWEWNFNGALQQRSDDASKLGMLYALTGDEKYAAFAKQILLALTDAYGFGKGSAVPDTHGYDHFGAYGFDGGDAGMFLAKLCHGYDLIYNLPALSADDHNHIENDLIRPMAEHLKTQDWMYTGHSRWGMVCLYGVFIAGETLNDQTLANLSLYGPGGTKDNVTGGFMDCFKSSCMRDGVIWGADTKPDEQMAALCALTTVAEVMWHRGTDLYSYHDSAIKKSYDAALNFTQPADLSTLLALPGVDAYPYVFRRYHDPRYLAIISKLRPAFSLAISEHLPPVPQAAAAAQ